jgi:hypothetical protein
MNDLYSSFTVEGPICTRPLILSQRSTASGPDAPILFQQACLAVGQARERIVLRRYFEHYSPDSGHWVEYAHSVPMADLIHWIMTHGQLQVACSDNAPTEHTP